MPFRILSSVVLLAVLVGCTDETISGQVAETETFTLTSINGENEPAPVTLRFPAKGEVAGQAPCNGYTASQRAPLPWFEVGPIAATRRACPDLAFETRYFEALRAMTLIERQGAVLILSNDAGQTLTFALNE